jgi:hypothetical protein
VCKVSKLNSLSNHLVVTTLLLRSERKLVPDVHPVTVLAIDALTTDLDLNHTDELLTGVVEPTGVSLLAISGSLATATLLTDLGESYLKVCAVCKITVAGDSALDTAAEIGLTIESLLNRLHGKVSVSAVSYFPESNLRISCKINILCAISY